MVRETPEVSQAEEDTEAKSPTPHLNSQNMG